MVGEWCTCNAETGMADDCALAGYFSKLLGILLSRSAEQILKYLKVSLLSSCGSIIGRHHLWTHEESRHCRDFCMPGRRNKQVKQAGLCMRGLRSCRHAHPVIVPTPCCLAWAR